MFSLKTEESCTLKVVLHLNSLVMRLLHQKKRWTKHFGCQQPNNIYTTYSCKLSTLPFYTFAASSIYLLFYLFSTVFNKLPSTVKNSYEIT